MQKLMEQRKVFTYERFQHPPDWFGTLKHGYRIRCVIERSIPMQTRV